MNIRPRINRWTAARRRRWFGDGLLDSLVPPHCVVGGPGVAWLAVPSFCVKGPLFGGPGCVRRVAVTA